MANTNTNNAKGEICSYTSEKYNTPYAVKTGKDVSKYSQNIYIARQINNLETQLFSDVPLIDILDKDGNKDIKLSNKYEKMLLDAGLERSMHVTFYEYMLYGCSVKTLGFSKVNNSLELSEIRDLPADTFYAIPQKTGNYEIPNPLMAGLVVNTKTKELYAEQCSGTNCERIPIENFKIFKEPSAPEPFGQAYCLPIYPILAQINEADKAMNSLINRIGTPIIMPKITDTSFESIEALNQWGKKFLRDWGKKSGFFVPYGIEFIEPHIYESAGAENRLENLKKVVESFFNPTLVLQHSETGLNGSDAGAQLIYYNFLKYTQRWICKCYEDIANSLLEFSGYDGYRCCITLISCQPQNSALILEECKMLISANAITKEELRRNCLNLDLDEWSEDLENKLNKSNYINENIQENVQENPQKQEIEQKPVNDSEKLDENFFRIQQDAVSAESQIDELNKATVNAIIKAIK